MTHSQFRKLKNNPAAIGLKVNFEKYIPSTDKYVKRQGFIVGFNTGVLDQEIVIRQSYGRNCSIHFADVGF